MFGDTGAIINPGVDNEAAVDWGLRLLEEPCLESGSPVGVAGVSGWPSMYVGLIVLLVVVGLCVIMGLIYIYLYFTRINPRSHQARKPDDGAGGRGGQDPADPSSPSGGPSAHPFFFRAKSTR